MAEEKLALSISKLLYDKKAQNLVTLRVAHLTVLTDYLVIATGHNQIQVRALCDHLEEQLAAQGIHPRRVEGRNEGSWVVMDYANVIVHIFMPDARGLTTAWNGSGKTARTAWNCPSCWRRRLYRHVHPAVLAHPQF